MAQAEKTNVIRLLEQKKIPYQGYCYVDSGVVSGKEVAAVLGKDTRQVFKTLVTTGSPAKYYVFVIPSDMELNLKKAAKAVGEKSIAMLKSKDLLPLTGYIHGGCSPIGMKKQFPTVIHHAAQGLDAFLVSAGKVGWQVEISPKDLEKMIRLSYADIADEPENEAE